MCLIIIILSGRRDSDSRPQPWQGCALPTELLPHNNNLNFSTKTIKIFLILYPKPASNRYCHSWQQDFKSCASTNSAIRATYKSGRRDSDSRPQPWQGCALPTELLPQLLFLLTFYLRTSIFFPDCDAKVRRIFGLCKFFGNFFSTFFLSTAVSSDNQFFSLSKNIAISCHKKTTESKNMRQYCSVSKIWSIFALQIFYCSTNKI